MKQYKILLLAVTLCGQSHTLYSQDITIASSDTSLVNVFEWAKEKARSFVVTGKRGPVDISERNEKSDLVDYIPSYWAGYPLRTAFYSRDYCHQIAGAHLLGLREENYSMMHAFAASANVSKKWYPLWAINFDGSPYKLDYINDESFVREVPATFELVEKNWQLYCWTGDKRFITDSAIQTYCEKAVSDFVTLHDMKFPNGVAEGTGTGNIFAGSCTFNEQRDVHLIEAGDAIACQYQAYRAYAEMAKAKGDSKTAKIYRKKAEELYKYFNGTWGVKGTSLYNRGYTLEMQPVDGWGKENSWFMPMKGLLDPQSPRTAPYLNYIGQRLDSKSDIPDNIEAISYIPEVFFAYGRAEEAWKWMKYIIRTINETHAQSSLTGRNGDYPEVSYVLIGNIVENMCGIVPFAPTNTIATASVLPQEMEYLTVNNVSFGSSLVNITHFDRKQSVLEYTKGNSMLTWEAGFRGVHKRLFINGKSVVSRKKTVNGIEYSYCVVKLNPGDKVTVTR